MTIRQFTLDAVTWTPIVAPLICHGCQLSDSARATTIKIRTDPNDATTQDSILPGLNDEIRTAPTIMTNYRVNDVVVYAQSALGTITAVARFF